MSEVVPNITEPMFDDVCPLYFDFPTRESMLTETKLIMHGEPVFVLGENGEFFGRGRFLGQEPRIDDFMPVVEVQGHVFRGSECLWALVQDTVVDMDDDPIVSVAEYLAVDEARRIINGAVDTMIQETMGIKFDTEADA